MAIEKTTTKNLFGDKPLCKITLRLPMEHINYLQKQAGEMGTTLTVCGEMAILDGIRSWKKEDQEVEQEAREKRKQEGYWKRSLRKYGIEPTEDE